ncbi:hypothetical protein CASFOL_020664 [Castilleja foliolosa]|uniref:Uncharacterized protein n=1 Tax=Castilleja foliolosa TaxID=1961234 RepID=A0ABD3D2B0_9LAMI
MATKIEAVVIVLQTLLICGLVNGMFESILGMLRGILIQTVLLIALLRSNWGAPADGPLYRFLNAVGFGCHVYMGVKFFLIIL